MNSVSFICGIFVFIIFFLSLSLLAFSSAAVLAALLLLDFGVPFFHSRIFGDITSTQWVCYCWVSSSQCLLKCRIKNSVYNISIITSYKNENCQNRPNYTARRTKFVWLKNDANFKWVTTAMVSWYFQTELNPLHRHSKYRKAHNNIEYRATNAVRSVRYKLSSTDFQMQT